MQIANFPLLLLRSLENFIHKLQGRIQKIQKEGAEETDDAVLHHSGSIVTKR